MRSLLGPFIGLFFKSPITTAVVAPKGPDHLRTQKVLGEAAKQALTEAASENRWSRAGGKKEARGLVVIVNQDNHGCCSIFVSAHRNGLPLRVLQFDLHVASSTVYLSTSHPTGIERVRGLPEFNELLRGACHYVRSWRQHEEQPELVT